MEWLTVQKKAVRFLKQYRCVILILALGLCLLLIPDRQTAAQDQTAETTQQVQQEDTAQSLAKILSMIQGAGKVEVMLTVASGEKTIYQTDEDIALGDNGATRIETVIVTSSDRSQTGLIQQVNPPGYLGAIVVCQGADRAEIRLAIVEAVSKVTGLGADRISVLKMK